MRKILLASIYTSGLLLAYACHKPLHQFPDMRSKDDVAAGAPADAPSAAIAAMKTQRQADESTILMAQMPPTVKEGAVRWHFVFYYKKTGATPEVEPTLTAVDVDANNQVLAVNDLAPAPPASAANADSADAAKSACSPAKTGDEESKVLARDVEVDGAPAVSAYATSEDQPVHEFYSLNKADDKVEVTLSLLDSKSCQAYAPVKVVLAKPEAPKVTPASGRRGGRRRH